MELGERMQQYTKLAPEQKLQLAVQDTMREATHRRPESEDDEYFVEGEPEVGYVPTILAHVDGELAGALWMQRGEAYSEHEWEIAKIEVYGEHQRKGLATVLWAAGKREYSLGHSGFQTEAGEAWAEHADAVVGDDGSIELVEPEWDVDERGNADLGQAQAQGRGQLGQPVLSALEARPQPFDDVDGVQLGGSLER